MSDKQVEFLLELRDAGQKIVDAANLVLEGLAPAGASAGSSYDVRKIAWQQVQGPRGPYEKIDGDNSADYQALLKDLQVHKGKMNIDGSFYWLFENQKTIGRKPRTIQ